MPRKQTPPEIGSRLTHLPVGGTRRWPTIDYSSLNTLADCQWRWHRKYVIGQRTEPTKKMLLGTLLGECCQAFWAGDDWRPVLKRWREEQPMSDLDPEQTVFGEGAIIPEWLERAEWIMARYEEHYGAERGRVRQIGAEIPFKLRLPGRYGWLVGRIDELWEIDRRIWIVERKTGGDFRKLDSGHFEWDPQTTLYWWAARQLGYDVWGIAVDFLRTYRWKRDYHPPADSFRQEWYDRTSEHLEAAIREAGKGLTLAKRLILNDLEPLRNLGEHCSWCDVKNECITDLAFGDLAVPDELFVEDW